MYELKINYQTKDQRKVNMSFLGYLVIKDVLVI